MSWGFWVGKHCSGWLLRAASLITEGRVLLSTQNMCQLQKSLWDNRHYHPVTWLNKKSGLCSFWKAVHKSKLKHVQMQTARKSWWMIICEIPLSLKVKDIRVFRPIKYDKKAKSTLVGGSGMRWKDKREWSYIELDVL